MPQNVEKQTDTAEIIEQELRSRFTEEQMCAYFLTKTIRSLYQFDDEFVANWYEKTLGEKPGENEEVRRQLVRAYTEMLMFENKYKFHLDYWLSKFQQNLIAEMETFFTGRAREL